MGLSSRNKAGINFDKCEDNPVGLSLHTHNTRARTHTHTHKPQNPQLKTQTHTHTEEMYTCRNAYGNTRTYTRNMLNFASIDKNVHIFSPRHVMDMLKDLSVCI
jgi:hypothetical protein